MNSMNNFLEQTLAYYSDLHTKYEIIEGCKLDRFTLFVDMDDGYLAYQIYYFNEGGERLDLDYKPEKGPFMVFYKAYEEVEALRKEANKSISFYEVIADMEGRFLEYATTRGYRKEIQFTLFYIPFFIDSSEPLVKVKNPLAIPLELLLQAGDMRLRN